ncbi:MAG: hypothetical protein QGI86_04000 [Candidatus Poribacteria bacterium]|nr:hypothetical protein [Candidatus Poribacteria bacterium]MDP6751438.1 hypothetical protein [Candidatus Poribacteria bacterium]MDP6995571.1 hypothetical protein [Candidatus Poribacteria bacterium]
MALDQNLDETVIFAAKYDGVSTADACAGNLDKNFIRADNRYGRKPPAHARSGPVPSSLPLIFSSSCPPLQLIKMITHFKATRKN